MSSLERRKQERRDVSFFSQHTECGNEVEIGKIACAPTCFKMCLEFFKIKPKMSVLDMFKYGISKGGKVGAGFRHDFIVREFERAGLCVKRYDKYGEYRKAENEIERPEVLIFV